MSLTPNQSQLLLSAININNDGVRFLAGRDTTNALRMFARALSVIDQNLWQSIDVQDGARILNTTSLSSMLLVPIPDLQDESFYVFDQALLLNPAICYSSSGPDGGATTTNPPGPTRGMVYAIAALVTFNMSLSGHRSHKTPSNSTRTTARGPVSLEATCRSYQLCLNLLDVGAKGCALDVAARNNLAHIKSQIMGDSVGASRLLDEVNLTNQGGIMSLPSNPDAEHLDQIMLNILMLGLSPCIKIAAAAA